MTRAEGIVNEIIKKYPKSRLTMELIDESGTKISVATMNISALQKMMKEHGYDIMIPITELWMNANDGTLES